MDRKDFERLLNTIHSKSAELKNPDVSMKDKLAEIRAERAKLKKKTANETYEVVADYLFQEGFTESFESALIVADAISNEWFDDIAEATGATKATVRGRVKVPGAAQKAVSRDDRKAEARARAEERKRQQEAERKYAEERRANPEILRKEAQKRTLSTRMEKAAQRLGLQ